MAFTGTPTATLLGDNICRVSGITLAAGQSGTIVDYGETGDINLPNGMPVVDSSEFIIHINGDENR